MRTINSIVTICYVVKEKNFVKKKLHGVGNSGNIALHIMGGVSSCFLI